MQDWDTNQIFNLLKECGRIAFKHYENPRTDVKSDLSLVTDADKEIESYLSRFFDRPEEGRFILGEETIIEKDENYIQEALNKTAYIVDPIDGTAPYAHHIDTWGISIGLMQNGTLQEGAIFLPPTGEMFISRDDSVYFYRLNSTFHRNQSLDTIADDADISSKKITPLPPEKRKYNESSLISLTQTVAKNGRFLLPNPIHAISCAVLPLSYLCLGRYLCYVAHVNLWDLAGGLPILLKCGLKGKLWKGDWIDTHVNSNIYYLDAGDKKRFRTKDIVILAPSEEIIDIVSKSIRFPE